MSREEEDKRVVQALAAVGVHVTSIWDLVNTSAPYPEAIPVLLRLLEDGIGHKRIAEGVVRALAVKEARGIAVAPPIKEFRRVPLDWVNYKWAIGNTLYTVADKHALNEIIALVQDKRHGVAREMLVSKLGFYKSPETTAVLIRLLEEDDLPLHTLGALGRHRAHEARDLIARHLSHPNPAVRRRAKSVLARLDEQAGGRR